MAFTGVTNAHGPTPQPTACRSPSCSLTTATEGNQAEGKAQTYLAREVSLGWKQPIIFFLLFSDLIIDHRVFRFPPDGSA